MPPTPSPSQIVAARRQRRVTSQRRFDRRLGRAGLSLIAVLGLVAALAIILVAAVYTNLAQGLPSLEALPLMLSPGEGHLLQPTRLYDRTGKRVLLTLENPGAPGRRYFSIDQNQDNHYPQALIDATIAAADPSFWEHQGYIFGNINAPSNRTIAQRLIGDLLLSNERPGSRQALRERLLAAQATAHFGRATILEWFLNSADYGNLAFGADAAARLYFGKSARDLSLAEAAMLAAVAEAPALNPFDAPQVAIERQGQVLQAMLAQGFLSTEEALSANANPIHIQAAVLPPTKAGSAFSRLVLEQLDASFGADRVRRGGFQIITTLDYDLQLQSECALQTQLARIGREGVSEDEDCEAARLLPTLSREDSVAGETVAASVVVIDPSTGQVLALVGDGAAGISPSNKMDQTPGTVLTPFIYLAAFSRGLSPASLVWDLPASSPPSLADQIDQGATFQGPVSIRSALANDYLAAALSTLSQVGPENAWRTAQQSGLHSLEIPHGEPALQLILDRGEIPLLEITHAFGTFANQGTLTGQGLELGSSNSGEALLQPSSILQVADYGERVWLDWQEPQVRPVSSAPLAYLMTHVLSDELARQASLGKPNPLEIGRPAAAKLGQTLSGGDAWTVGYTPQLVVGVWLGYPQGGEESTISPLVAAGLWHALMQYAHRELPLVDWETPPEIQVVEVCSPSGLLPTLECPKVVSEVFIPGNEPTQLDNLYRAFTINSQTGRLATVFTAPELVEEQVYLVVPPEAADWAQSAGLATPPQDYDAVFAPVSSSPNVNLLAPQMFDYVSGQVMVLGSAGGPDFDFYRVQVGEGLNPRQWLQIGADKGTAVESGDLVSWDTEGFDGLYALRLVVVEEDQSIETAIIQVTVDNQPPEVQIISPTESETLSLSQNESVTLQAQVVENLALSQVEFLIDGELISKLTQAPFAATWHGDSGQHRLVVRATDQAGNQSEEEINFVVE